MREVAVDVAVAYFAYMGEPPLLHRIRLMKKYHLFEVLRIALFFLMSCDVQGYASRASLINHYVMEGDPVSALSPIWWPLALH